MTQDTINALNVGLKADKNQTSDQGWSGWPGRK
jgi:hypothetical protein